MIYTFKNTYLGKYAIRGILVWFSILDFGAV